MKSWVEISEQRLAANYRLLSAAAGNDLSVLAVVKANAYGHGAELCAPVLAAAGAQWFGVTDAAEGATVRAALTEAGTPAKHQPRVLVMSESLDEDAETIVHHRLTPVVSSVDQLESLARTLQDRHQQQPFEVHLEIDTGMARQGVSPGAPLHRILEWLGTQSTIRLDGVMTHFASAEIAGSHQTASQRILFEEAVAQIATSGLRPGWIHAGNSSTVDNPAEGPLPWLDTLARGLGARAMVRSGLALYGYALPLECEQSYPGPVKTVTPQVRARLQTVMTWRARITALREIEADERIGYNGTFTSERRMRLALLPVGYADGLRRELSSTNAHRGGWVILRGERAPIVGRVSMNLTIVDVTAIPAAALGDEAIVLGEGITADDHARIAGTIPYEILCAVKEKRVLR